MASRNIQPQTLFKFLHECGTKTCGKIRKMMGLFLITQTGKLAAEENKRDESTSPKRMKRKINKIEQETQAKPIPRSPSHLTQEGSAGPWQTKATIM